MDTVKSGIVNAGAAQQSGEEPLSGVTGKGTAGEPYDQGNAEGVYLQPRLISPLPVVTAIGGVPLKLRRVGRFHLQ